MLAPKTISDVRQIFDRTFQSFHFPKGGIHNLRRQDEGVGGLPNVNKMSTEEGGG